MKHSVLTKALIIGIIMLFASTSIVPAMTGNRQQLNQQGSTKTLTTWSIFDNSFTTANPSVAPGEVQTNCLISQNLDKTADTRDINNTRISQPFNNDIYRPGEIVPIEGIANGTGFQFYIIEWGVGDSPSTWVTTGITLENDGLVPVVNDSLGFWDTSSITDKSFLTLRLTVNFTTYQEEAIAQHILIDPSLKQGWPIRVPFEYNEQGAYYYWPGNLEPVVADINADSLFETIIYTGGNPPKLSVYKDDGSLLWNAGIGNTDASGGNLAIPIVGDINNDGFQEIVVFRYMLTQTSQVYVYKHDGTVLTGWPVTLGKEYHPTLMLADLNIDGYLEIIFKGNDAVDRKIVIMNYTGEILSQFSVHRVSWGSSIPGSPAVGNFDGDPELEIVTADPSENAGYNWTSGEWINEGVIHVYNMDGSEVAGWPKYTEGVTFCSPAVGDINKDGYYEILVGLQYAGNAPDERWGGVYAYDRHGDVLPGWPFEKGWNFQSNPSLADFDKDGDLEIVTSRLGFYTYVIHHDGTLASGWPQETSWNDYYSTVLGDINGDGGLDIVTTAGNGFYPSIYNGGGVYAWNYDGTPIAGFPKATDCDAQAPAVIADIDHDGKVEIVASSDWDYDFITAQYKFRGALYAWDLDSDYNASTMEWPTFHRDVQRTGLYPKTMEPQPEPKLELGNITSKSGRVQAVITNTGEGTVANVSWNITLTGGFIIFGKKTIGTIETLGVGENQTVASKLIFGFGKTMITVTATAPGCFATRQQNATVFLFFVRVK
jgi:hypothetical protein